MQLFQPVYIAGIGLEFFLFALTLIGVALLHKQTMKVAIAGMILVIAYKLLFTPFDFHHHFLVEWKGALNLFGLLLGFGILANHFEHSGVPVMLPKYLPDDWKGGFVLLIVVFVLSALLDNIAAAMIGGGIAHVVYKKKVHIGFLAAIVAASNAGGSGSVLGDTTTTMMWLHGIPASQVLCAYIAAIPALFISGIIASFQQHRYQPIVKDAVQKVHISWKRIGVCVMILTGAIVTNLLFDFPALGVWAAIIIGSFIITTHWKVIRHDLGGAIFLLSLVIAASLMPVERLPAPTWLSTFGLGFVSALFDNIPLTKLALEQGGYDWSILAYAVGFGGSMVWFGSSAGVAISNMYEEAKSVTAWLKNGWHVVMAYIVSYFIMLAICGWHP